MNWYVYLLECNDGSLYCGVTTNPERRLEEHNGLRPGGARYTRGRRPVRLAACVEQPDRSAALRLEADIKKTPRAGKVKKLLATGETDERRLVPQGDTNHRSCATGQAREMPNK